MVDSLFSFTEWWVGIRNLRRFNQALLGKWLWRFATERDALWRKVVEVKYGSMAGGWCTNQVMRSYGVGFGSILGEDGSVSQSSLNLRLVMYHISFWHDTWCGDQPLKVSYPELYRIARNKKAWVSDNMQILNEVVHWNVHFIREAQDWEVEVVMDFYGKLYETQRHMGGGGWIGFVGVLPRGSYLRLAPSLMCFPFQWIGMRRGVLSRGRAFGRLKYRAELVFLCGQLLLVRFSLWIIFAKEV
jgi:hypothetical protein